jgi:FkbM family methyltransferase
MRALGRYGVIQGSASDSSVFGTYARTGVWAEATNALVSKFFARSGGGTYLDIGANIGLTTIPIAQNAMVSCIAFEPEPANFENLRTNVAANCCHGNVGLHQEALFDRVALLEFELASGNLGDHRIRLKCMPGQFGEESRKVIKVSANRLDVVAPAIRLPLVAKIDTQGAEPFVVAGGHETLSKADLLILEWWPYGMARLHGDPAAVTDFLRSSLVTVSVAKGETGAHSTPIPVAKACDQLLADFDTDRVNARSYKELIASR